MKTKFSFYQFLVLILRLKFVKLVPDEYCLPPLNTSDCGLPPTAVFSYYKAGSRCEIETWRGCPTQNMFENEYHCSHHCISRLKFYGRERGSSINDLTLTELEEINRILHKIEHIPNVRENRIHTSPKPYNTKTIDKSPVKNASREIINDTTEYDDGNNEEEHKNEDDENESVEESNETTGNHHSEEDIDENTEKDNIKELTHKINSTKTDHKASNHHQSEESKESEESEKSDGEEITVVPLTQVPVTGSYEDPIPAFKLREQKT